MAPGAPVRVACPGKLNLFLEVAGRRPDGYHDIETVMVPAPVADVLEVAASDVPGISLDLRFAPGREDPSVPAGAENLVVRAARRVLDEAGSGIGLRMMLSKSIPAGAGLGGGSSDAAGSLMAVHELLGRPVPAERLAAIALSLGSDVPYFLAGGAALARGRGEILRSVSLVEGLRFLVLFPRLHVATADVYARCVPPAERREPGEVLAALAAGDARALSRACFNRLEEPARAAVPALGDALDRLRSLGLGPVHMTGSGSACFVALRPGDPVPQAPPGVDAWCG